MVLQHLRPSCQRDHVPQWRGGVGDGWEVGVLTFSLIHAVCLGELAAYSRVSPLKIVGCFGVEVGWWLQ